jgi:hypothetical protein
MSTPPTRLTSVLWPDQTRVNCVVVFSLLAALDLRSCTHARTFVRGTGNSLLRARGGNPEAAWREARDTESFGPPYRFLFRRVFTWCLLDGRVRGHPSQFFVCLVGCPDLIFCLIVWISYFYEMHINVLYLIFLLVVG